MSMNDLQWLTWVRGTGFNIAVGIFLLGVVWRLIEVYTLGRKPDLAAPRHVPGASGWHTIVRRSLPPPGMLARSPVSYIGGYVFHVGLAIVVFFFAQHILLVKQLTGLSWPGLPSQLINLTAVVTMVAMLAVLVDRIRQPVKRFLSTFEDWFTWALTFLPLVTGWMATQHLLLPYTRMLALHILTVELLLVFLPFTKLFHAFALIGSRWYNGDTNGRKGVPV
jgi:nitrate reductase gamma subunit